MEDIVSFIFATFAIVLLCIFLPMLNIFLRQDDMNYTQVLKATTNFVDTVRTRGYINDDVMSKFTDELASTGLTYNIEIEAHKRYLIKEGDNYIIKYLIDYNDQIFDNMDVTKNNTFVKDGIYTLDYGDKIYIKVKNNGSTMSTNFLNAMALFGERDEIDISYGGRILSESWKKEY